MTTLTTAAEETNREPADGYFYQHEKCSGNRLNNAQDRLFLFSTMVKSFAYLAVISFRFARFTCFLLLDSLVFFRLFRFLVLGFVFFLSLEERKNKRKGN